MRGERRRSWTAEQKREIAAESLEAGTSPVTVARKHGISTGQLYTWRQQLLRSAIGTAGDTKPGFVRVDVVTGPPRLEAVSPARPELDSPAPSMVPPAAPSPAQPDGRIEITLSRGVSVRVDAKVDGAALRRVLAALERS
jgi:transposase